MVEFEITTRFQEGDATRHRVPAYEGTQSLQGVSRGLVLVSHYVSTGAVRHRAPFSGLIKHYLTPLRQGSLDAIISVVVSNPELLAIGVSGSIIGNLLTDAVRTVFRRVIGHEAHPNDDSLRNTIEERPGDFEALVDATEPSIRQAHTVIGQGAENIVIVKGQNNVVNFNSDSKRYVESSTLSDIEEEQDVSIGSLNVNSGYGRAYLSDIGKTVPFVISSSAAVGTGAILSYSLNEYASNRPSTVTVKFRRVIAPDGRTKRLQIYGAQLPEH